MQSFKKFFRKSKPEVKKQPEEKLDIERSKDTTDSENSSTKSGESSSSFDFLQVSERKLYARTNEIEKNNFGISEKYCLLTNGDYSPPLMRRNIGHFSAIPGPTLPTPESYVSFSNKRLEKIIATERKGQSLSCCNTLENIGVSRQSKSMPRGNKIRQFDEPHYKVPISPPKPVKANDLHGICRKPIPRPRKIKALKDRRKKSVELQSSTIKEENLGKLYMRINLFVEDETAHFGPISLKMSSKSSLSDLKAAVRMSYNIPEDIQTWIVGKTRVKEDDVKIYSLCQSHIVNAFLYIKQNHLTKETPDGRTQKEETRNEKGTESYQQTLAKLEEIDVIPNTEDFHCTICLSFCEAGEGVVLHECLHVFCRDCLEGTIKNSEVPFVTCPFIDKDYSCESLLQEREIKKLVSQNVYEHLQKLSLNAAKGDSTCHCYKPNCEGWFYVEDNLEMFTCNICGSNNCLKCKVIHTGLTCLEYKNSKKEEDENAMKTNKWIQEILDNKDGMYCPSCKALLLKKWGCDWLKCSYCKAEICWVTQQLRWGPKGKGDTSGGCKCLIDGKTKCHPNCNYCH